VIKRGRILRIPQSGPGLLMLEGRQYGFQLETTWKSGFAPQLGMVVDVEIAERGEIASVQGVPESQLVEEQKLALAVPEQPQSSLRTSDIANVGRPTLIATALLIVGWFVLSAASLRTPVGSLDFTFWQLLSVLNSSSVLDGLLQGDGATGNPGVYGLAALLALAGPFFHYAWNNRRAFLGAVLPLAFTLLVGIVLRNRIAVAFHTDGDAGYQASGEAMKTEAMKAISLGVGSYLSILASVYLGMQGLRRFLMANPKVQEGKQTFQAAA
jgi:hypothetical protein